MRGLLTLSHTGSSRSYSTFARLLRTLNWQCRPLSTSRQSLWYWEQAYLEATSPRSTKASSTATSPGGPSPSRKAPAMLAPLRQLHGDDAAVCVFAIGEL